MIFGKYINQFYKKYFFHYLFGILFLILVNVIQLYIPEITGSITRKYDNGTLTQTYLYFSVLWIVLIAFGLFIGRFAWRKLLFNGAINIQGDLRKMMFNKTQQLDQKFYQDNKVGGIMSYYTNDLDVLNQCFGFGTVMLVDALVLSVLTLVKMFRLNVILTLICLIPMAVLAVSAYFIDNKIEAIFEKRQKSYEKMTDYVQEMFVGIRVIKAFARTKDESKFFKTVNKDTKDYDISLVKVNTFLNTAISILIELMIALGLLVGGLIIYNAFIGKIDSNFSRGDLYEFNGYFNTIIWPMMALGQIIALRSRAKTSLKRITKFLDENVDLIDNKTYQFKDKIEGDIEFKHLSYRYEKQNVLALDDVSFKINKGEIVGIVGRIGSGKTTLVSTLIRLDNYSKGTIFIDGIDIMDLSINQLRDNVAFVFQDNYLFSQTIKDNIAFSNPSLSQEEVEKAARFASIDDDIKDFIDGYRTLLGERGVTISGGQKQRLAIARAIIKDSPIMVLDDSLSAVDLKTEKTILKNIVEERKNKTTLIVASRVSTVMDLDKIIVLNEGKVEAIGNHKTLMKESKTYFHMVKLQTLEDEIKE